MTQPNRQGAGLPATGYIRQVQVIGESEITPEMAAHNRERGKGPRRPRPGVVGVVPISSATLWRKVNLGEFPAPDKLSERVTAWRVEKIRAWLDAQELGTESPTAAVPAPTAPPATDAPVKRGRGRPRKVAAAQVAA